MPDDTNLNSVLAVADNVGHVHLFMEGSYLLGSLPICEATYPRSLYKLRDHFFAHLGPSSPGEGAVSLLPHTLKLPYLATRHCRDVGRVSTAARELVSYVIHVIKDMRDAWFGNESQGGARDLGPKWIQSLEARQQNEFGRKCGARRTYVRGAHGHRRAGAVCIVGPDVSAHNGAIVGVPYGLPGERGAYEREGALAVRITFARVRRPLTTPREEYAKVGDHDGRRAGEAPGHVREACGAGPAAVASALAGGSGMGCAVRTRLQ